jgi:hypothetical protein
MPTVHLLDYVAGNVRSLVNAIEKLGYTVEWVKTPVDVAKADVCGGKLALQYYTAFTDTQHPRNSFYPAWAILATV